MLDGDPVAPRNGCWGSGQLLLLLLVLLVLLVYVLLLLLLLLRELGSVELLKLTQLVLQDGLLLLQPIQGGCLSRGWCA